MIESETSNYGAGYLKYEFNADQDGHYKYQLEACNSSGCSEKSDLSSAVKMLTVKPHKPTGFAVIDKQLDPKHYVDQVYKVRWNHNASTDSVSHYNLERATKPWGGNSFNIDTISVDSDSQAEAPTVALMSTNQAMIYAPSVPAMVTTNIEYRPVMMPIAVNGRIQFQYQFLQCQIKPLPISAKKLIMLMLVTPSVGVNSQPL